LRLTLPHYARLERSLEGPDDWDALRATNPAFASPLGDVPAMPFQYRAESLSPFLRDPVVSYGAGTGQIEWWLRRLGHDITVTDYAPETLKALSARFPARRHDLRLESPLSARTHLFHRIDAELSNREWRTVLDRFRHERIVFVAGAALSGLRVRMWWQLRKEGAATAGWTRTLPSLERLWSATHQSHPIQCDLPAWLLEPRNRST
jgi:hypothetical protein